ncbi:MAG: hypothetical protein AAGM22_25285 [Acidobacteriota bacterium]
MGKTRTRVTFLVLSMEAMGIAVLGLALYLVGDSRVECRRAEGAAPSASRDTVVCEASARRLFGLLRFESRTYGEVSGFARDEPALGRFEHWLVLETPGGRERVLPGSEARTEADLERLRAVLAGQAESYATRRSAAPLAFAAAAFGCLWIMVISLIMREFLGFHTPWWWRLFGREGRV